MGILEWAYNHMFWSYWLMGLIVAVLSAIIWGEEWAKKHEEEKKKKKDHPPLSAIYVIMFILWPIQVLSVIVDAGRAIKKAIFNRKTYVCECKHVNKKSAKFCSCCGKSLT